MVVTFVKEQLSGLPRFAGSLLETDGPVDRYLVIGRGMVELQGAR
jgi:hypothetical protein